MEYFRFSLFILIAVLSLLAGLVIGVLACAGQFSAEYLIAGVQVLRTRPGDLPARLRVFSPPPGDDPAKPAYFYGPARSDLRYVRQVARQRWRRAIAWWMAAIRGREEVIGEQGEAISERRGAIGGRGDAVSDTPDIMVPLGIGLAIGLVLALPVAVLLAAALLLAHELAVDIATIGVRSAAAGLRAVDTAHLSVRHIKLRCAACHERIPYPAYRCPNPACERIHRKIGPGRYGVLRRTCECGEKMLTMPLLFRAAGRFEALCPRHACQRPLEYRPGEAREIVLPLFGAKGAGKTLLLYGIVKTLRELSPSGAQIADSHTSAWLNDLDLVMASHAGVPATPVARPQAQVLRLQMGSQRRIVQFVDTAGELFYDSKRSADLIYLGAANTFILVIDPLSVTVFWKSLPSAARQRLTVNRSAAPRPDLVFQQTADRIAEMGGPRARHRLAIVFSRADLLGTEYGPGPGEGDEIRRWALAELGLRGLVHRAESEFRNVAFFHTAPFSEKAPADEKDGTLPALTQWLLRAEGVDPGTPGPPEPADLGQVPAFLVSHEGEARQGPGPPVPGRPHVVLGGRQVPGGG
jgi:Double-GTPase 2